MIDSFLEEEYKPYKLDERTYVFASAVRKELRKLKIEIWNESDIRQLLRSSGSVAANYIEANENLGAKDLRMKIKICRKEAKESVLWLNLLIQHYSTGELLNLRNEAEELKRIFSSILNKLPLK